ncbi:hypothetical protein [Pseudomarimonas arenosa]|uniref:Transporter n=1 Tax=Pseudomarimonas arenosa TaxID=2774145 RepID=A0AAW3ZIE5_9GAMM|nr:hypothetical protein [Pseudomarimonas arenosa]MBD8524907.1 hypothetical protein [Pseudomarimonas arenosa]
MPKPFNAWITGTWLLLTSPVLPAQSLPVSEGVDRVGVHSEEGWAVRYVGASSLMTGFGALPELAPGEWLLAGELGHIPSLSARQQEVGLGGIKQEDLNKSPIFGRVRGWMGLPGGWVAELGYTPPLEIDGAKPVDLFAAAVGKRFSVGERAALSLRALGQHGAARGDITCSDHLVGRDVEANPFRCARPSDDRIALSYYGLEATGSWRFADWEAHLTGGTVRYEPEVQVNAQLESYIERIRLINRGQMPYFALGAQQNSGTWRFGAELLYVPLDVRRDGGPLENDPLWSLRLSLRWRP